MSYARGNQLFEAGRYQEAVEAYREELARLTPADDEWAADLYENLGLTLFQLGQWQAAARCLLRTLDGGTREQALRLLVSSLFRGGHPLEGERFLRLYQEQFGPHPEGWARDNRQA